MEHKQRKSVSHRVQFFGPVTLANALDWLVAFFLIAILGLLTKELGGARTEQLELFVWLWSGLIGFHMVWLVVAHGKEPFVLHKLALVFVPFLIYITVHTWFLSPTPWLAQREWLLFIQGFGIFWVVVHNFRLRSHIWFLFLGVMAIAGCSVLISYNQYFRYPDQLPLGLTLAAQYEGRATGPFGAPNSFAGYMLLVIFPMLVAAFSRRLSAVVRTFCGYVAVMFILGLVLTKSRGGAIVLLGGVALLPIVLGWRGRKLLLAWLGVTVALIFSGLLIFLLQPEFVDRFVEMVDEKGESSRKILWQAAWGLFQDHPVTGSGLGSYRMYFESYREEGLGLGPLYVHNEYLQALAELGVVGFALLFGALGYAYWKGFRAWRQIPALALVTGDAGKKSRKVPTIRLFLGGVLMALLVFAVHEILEFHFKLPALFFWAALYFGILVKCIPDGLSKLQLGVIPRLGAMLAVWVVVVVLALWAVPRYKAYSHIFEGTLRLKSISQDYRDYANKPEYLEGAVEHFKRGVELVPENADGWNGLASATEMLSRYEPRHSYVLGIEGEISARKALALNALDDEYWTTLGRCLALQGRSEEAEECYRKAIELAPYGANQYYYLASLLDDDPERREEALAMVEKAIAYTPNASAAKALRTRILIP